MGAGKFVARSDGFQSPLHRHKVGGGNLVAESRCALRSFQALFERGGRHVPVLCRPPTRNRLIPGVGVFYC